VEAGGLPEWGLPRLQNETLSPKTNRKPKIFIQDIDSSSFFS
jgi:hypothetical protein